MRRQSQAWNDKVQTGIPDYDALQDKHVRSACPPAVHARPREPLARGLANSGGAGEHRRRSWAGGFRWPGH